MNVSSRGQSVNIGERRPRPSAVAAGPRTHEIIDSLARGGASYREIAQAHGISRAAVGKVYKGRQRHQLHRRPLLQDGQPVHGFEVEGCLYCGAWRRWRTAGDGKRYVTDWTAAPTPWPTA